MKLKYNNLLMNSLIDRILSRSKGPVNASYKIINDFESSSEKECSKMDRENERIYSKLLTQAEKAHSAIKNSGLSMNLEVPIPPRPSNRDRYLLWKKRNVSKKVIDQTEAVLFLQDNGYKYNEHYEAYQAIDLAIEIKKTKGDPIEWTDTSKNFDNVYNKNDRNIFRRRSMYKLNQQPELSVDSNKMSSNIINNQTFKDVIQEINLAPSAPPPSDTILLNDLSLMNDNCQNNFQYNNSLNQENYDLNYRKNIRRRSLGSVSPDFGFNNNKSLVRKRAQTLNKSYLPNYTQIQENNLNINSTKPSAPPASINIQQKTINSSSDYNFDI